MFRGVRRCRCRLHQCTQFTLELAIYTSNRIRFLWFWLNSNFVFPEPHGCALSAADCRSPCQIELHTYFRHFTCFSALVRGAKRPSDDSLAADMGFCSFHLVSLTPAVAPTDKIQCAMISHKCIYKLYITVDVCVCVMRCRFSGISSNLSGRKKQQQQRLKRGRSLD